MRIQLNNLNGSINRPRAFFFHYNKPASHRAGKAQISVHFNKQCMIVDNVECYVPTYGRIKTTAPRFVMSGQAHAVDIKDGVAIIL